MMIMMMKVDGVQKEMDERNLRPRLCYLTKGERGYGFHLHGERSSGAQFIRRIEAESPAELAGLRSGDRVVEVNGENVEKLTHQEVVQKIMEVENRTRLLVVDRATDEFLLLHSLPCSEDLAVEMSCLLSPRTSSSSLASSTLSFSSSSRGSVTPSPPASIVLSPRRFTTQSLSDSVTSSPLPKSITSSRPDSVTPLPGGSSPRKSPDDFIERSLRDAVNRSPCGSAPRLSPSSINQLPCDSITRSSSNSINQLPPSNPINQSPSKSVSQSPYDSITGPTSDPIPPPPPSTSMTQSPYDSITGPTSDPIPPPPPCTSMTQSPYDSITGPVSNCATPPPSDSTTQSPYDSITPSPTGFITTPFSMEGHVTKIVAAPDRKKTAGTEDAVTRDLRPRLCHIVKDQQGFGFNLHCNKRRVGHFIRSVDPDSPAQRSGLQPGDRLIQVNGRSVSGLRHGEVVEIIRTGGEHAKLLVVDPETDALFQKLDISPTTAHLNEDCVDGPLIQSPTSSRPITDSVSTSPCKTSNGSSIPAPTSGPAPPDPPIRNGSLKQQSQGSSSLSSSSSSRCFASEMSSELSSSDTNHQVLDCNSAPGGQEDKVVTPVPDPLCASGLHLSPTAAEARQKVRSKKANKRAPPMAWNKKYEIFSNF